MTRQLLLLTALCVTLDISTSFILHRIKPTSKHVLSSSLVSIDLTDTYNLNTFLNSFTGNVLSGVYVGFNDKGKIVTADYSVDVVRSLSTWTRDVTSVKIQTFSDTNELKMKTYLDSLLKQLSTIPETEVEEVPIVSPFSTSVVVPENDDDDDDDEDEDKGWLPLTKSNVDDVLEEVRPYLIADGGNVKVVSVNADTQVIELALQGACGSCPSSTTTMKMGIERVLRENFPLLKEVLSITESPPELLTLESIQTALVKISPAIKALKGTVEITNVDGANGVVTVSFKGPSKLKQGVELVIKDIPLVKEVVVVDLV